MFIGLGPVWHRLPVACATLPGKKVAGALAVPIPNYKDTKYVRKDQILSFGLD